MTPKKLRHEAEKIPGYFKEWFDKQWERTADTHVLDHNVTRDTAMLIAWEAYNTKIGILAFDNKGNQRK